MNALPIAIALSGAALLVNAAGVSTACAQTVSPADLHAIVDPQIPGLVDTYKTLHEHPELSHHEEKTSALLATDLRQMGYDVTEHIGKYGDGSQAFGIVAILKNGAGPQVLVRTDMDALPVEEKTDLPYASHVHSHNAEGQEVSVMHACGHDIHMTTLLGVARTMAALKSKWHGTLMLVGQPSEETIDGARAMLADNLYERFGKPDYVLAEHDINTVATGGVGITSGPALASSTSINVTMRGVGSHGAHPDAGKDPIVMAAEFILDLQTIVSRQVSAQLPAVITVGQIHGGTKRNIIPDHVEMQLTMRTFDEKQRQAMIEAIRRTAQGVAVGMGVPAGREPIVAVSDTEVTPVTYNDPALSERFLQVETAALGDGHVEKIDAEMGSEDVGLFALDRKIPMLMYRAGAADPAKLADSRKTSTPLPALHSPLFAPVPASTIQTGVVAMSAMAIDLMKK